MLAECQPEYLAHGKGKSRPGVTDAGVSPHARELVAVIEPALDLVKPWVPAHVYRGRRSNRNSLLLVRQHREWKPQGEYRFAERPPSRSLFVC